MWKVELYFYIIFKMKSEEIEVGDVVEVVEVVFLERGENLVFLTDGV